MHKQKLVDVAFSQEKKVGYIQPVITGMTGFVFFPKTEMVL